PPRAEPASAPRASETGRGVSGVDHTPVVHRPGRVRGRRRLHPSTDSRGAAAAAVDGRLRRHPGHRGAQPRGTASAGGRRWVRDRWSAGSTPESELRRHRRSRGRLGTQAVAPAGSLPSEPGPAHPNPVPWGPEFGAAGQTEAAAEPMRSAGAPAPAGALHSQGGQAPGRPEAGPVRPESGSGGQQPAYGPAYAAAPAAGPAYGASGPGGPGGPTGPGGPGGPMGPGGPYGDRPETKKVPAWLWVLASIALVLALGIVGYIVWDSTQGTDEVTAPPSDQPTTGRTDPQPSASDSSSPPVAEEVFTSPSGNI